MVALARVAVGAAVECALLRAGRMGATVRFQVPRANALVTLTISGPKRTPEPDKALVRRATNRRLYDARPLDDATFAWLREATPPLETVRTHWFGRERVRVLGPLIEDADSLYYGDPRLREAALRAIHFDVRDREEVAHGLSLGCLELSGPERVTFDLLHRMPQERLESMGVFKKMGARARRLVESAVWRLRHRGDRHGAEHRRRRRAGDAARMAAGASRGAGLSAQPMSSVASLGALLEGDLAGVPSHERMAAVLVAFRARRSRAVDHSSRIALVLRFGWASPTVRPLAAPRARGEYVATVASASAPPVAPASAPPVAAGKRATRRAGKRATRCAGKRAAPPVAPASAPPVAPASAPPVAPASAPPVGPASGPPEGGET